MNNQRRKDIDSAMVEAEKLDTLAGNVRMAIEAFREAAEDVTEAIQEIEDAEQEAFDNLPESLQFGEKGMDMEAAIVALQSAIEELDIDRIDWDNWCPQAIVGHLDEAKGVQ